MGSSQWDLEVVAAGLRRHSSDLSLYAGFLLSTLSEALPPELVQLERERGLGARLRRGEPPVTAVSVLLGDLQFTLRRAKVGAAPAASVGHQSGGVVLRTETLPLVDWSRQLALALADYAQHNAGVADALARFTLPDPR
jgi:hypothetical protein